MPIPVSSLSSYFPSWRSCLTQSVSTPIQQKLGWPQAAPPNSQPVFQQGGATSVGQPAAPDAPAFAYPDYALNYGPSADVTAPPQSQPPDPTAPMPVAGDPAIPAAAVTPALGPGAQAQGEPVGRKSVSSELTVSLREKLSQKLGRLFRRKPEQSPLAQTPEGMAGLPPGNPSRLEQPVEGQLPSGKPGEPGQPARPGAGQAGGSPNPGGLQRMTAPPDWKPGDPIMQKGPWSDTIMPLTVEQMFKRGTKGLYRYTKRPHYSLTPEQIRVNYLLKQQECLQKVVYSMKWNDDDHINPFSDRVATEH